MYFQDRKDLAISVALSFLGKPYIYGAQSPLTGFDCSGLVVEVFKAVGLIGGKEDLSAQQLELRYSKNVSIEIVPGCLVFFGGGLAQIHHVGLCVFVDKTVGPIMIEAGGGDSLTTSLESAKAIGACVRVRPVRNRKDFVCAVNPFE